MPKLNPFQAGAYLRTCDERDQMPTAYSLRCMLREAGLPKLAEVVEDMHRELEDAGLRQCDSTHGCRQWFESKLHDSCPDCTPSPEPAVNDDARQVRDDWREAVGAPR